MNNPLVVRYRDWNVGLIITDDGGGMTFEYTDTWRDSPESFALSASLPLNGEWTRGREDHRWFANLLPEGQAREALGRSLGIGIDNDAAFLERIGGDCAGAIRIIPEGQEKKEEYGYQPVSSENLRQLTESRIPFRKAAGMGLIRLSLAGAQDKWPVKWDGERIFLPVGGAPGTHIIKFPGPGFSGLAFNEAFTTRLAGICELPVTDARPFGDWLITPRYDRITDEERTYRIHQEDFCQALGLSSRTKYQSEGGPSLADCADLIRQRHERPAIDLRLLVRWQIFNVLAGNADGHAKNISRLFDTPGGRMTPFYDLVCTAAYEGISTLLAMRVGNQDNPGHIRRDDWSAMAESLGIHSRLVFREIERISSTISSTLDNAAHSAITEWGENAEEPIRRVVKIVNTRLRRITTLLSS